MHEQTIPTLLWVYFGLVFVNILITLVQLLIERGLAERTLFLFWLGIALATFSNTLFPDQPVLTLATSPIGTFISQLFLGRFFAHIHDIRVPWKPFLFSFIFGYLTSQLLGLTDVGLTFQSMPVVLGATLPVPGHFYLVHKRSRYKYSTMQMLFISVALLMSLHYLDWGFFRARPFLFVYGLSLAIALYHILATITPLISSESTLQKRNQNLEEEVRHKASLLTSTERQLWEANKMASYARMAGGMAHEINTPLQVIEFQAEELRSEIESHPNGSEEMKSGLDTIQEMVLRISKITNSLRKLARENLSVLFQVADLGDMARSAIANLAPVAISQSTHLISR
ncbi:MAG: hypothetical protein NDI61_10590, partial [Bdellovibrionaceae bacterium]|nr:hypothetical protein [Pseudobdellovibrionaceae bacterium]